MKKLEEIFTDPDTLALAIKFLGFVPDSLGEPPHNGCHEGSIRHHAAESLPHMLNAGTILKDGGIPFWLGELGYITYAGSNGDGQSLYVRTALGRQYHDSISPTTSPTTL
ncbi:hypothetical protein HYU10_05015 [Candidatus Woesearchaeota archaeon]|nr:hypothetical protein [Candidatus Woesearchaeota archaeon]MBI2660641.1 hypothetical protein [Candidatus Woesearchaeota archaeon]